MARAESDPSTKWQGAGCGEHYAGARFASRRAKDRDLVCVLGLLDAHAGQAPVERLLDVPCGSGRLSQGLVARSQRYVAVDVSRTMLQAALPLVRASGADALLLEARVPRLPFQDRAFDVVVACRFLHHLHEETQLAAAIAELTRVSRGLVIASFWDARSLPQLRRRLGLKTDEGPRGRVAVQRAQLAHLFEQAGATVQGWRSTLRFVSQQTFVAARVRGPQP